MFFFWGGRGSYLEHAQDNLAVCYQNGDGVPKDMKEAVRYYQLAADQNFAQASEA